MSSHGAEVGMTEIIIDSEDSCSEDDDIDSDCLGTVSDASDFFNVNEEGMECDRSPISSEADLSDADI